MSVEATAAVWAMRGLSGTEKLVAVRLADHAGPDGTNAYPSVKRLAEDACMDERTVQRTLRKLITRGVISKSTKAGPHGTQRYSVNLAWRGQPATPADDHRQSAAPADDRVAESPEGVASDPERGGAAPPEPSVTVNEPSSSSSLKAKKTAQRRTRIPEPFMLTAAMREWAAENTPSVDVREETTRFADHYRGTGATMADWQATWRNWMRKAVDIAARSKGRTPATAGPRLSKGSDAIARQLAARSQ